MFQYWTEAGERSEIRTRTSHNGQEIGDILLSHMARQVGLTKRDFLDLVDCPLSRAQYEHKVGLRTSDNGATHAVAQVPAEHAGAAPDASTKAATKPTSKGSSRRRKPGRR